MRDGLRVPQRFVDLAAGHVALRPIAHAVGVAPTARQCGVHADDQRLNGGGLFGAVYHGMKPGELGGIELVRAGVIHGDEIDIAIDPVIVRAQFMILRIVL